MDEHYLYVGAALVALKGGGLKLHREVWEPVELKDGTLLIRSPEGLEITYPKGVWIECRERNFRENKKFFRQCH